MKRFKTAMEFIAIVIVALFLAPVVIQLLGKWANLVESWFK